MTESTNENPMKAAKLIKGVIKNSKLKQSDNNADDKNKKNQIDDSIPDSKSKGTTLDLNSIKVEESSNKDSDKDLLHKDEETSKESSSHTLKTTKDLGTGAHNEAYKQD